MTYRLFFLKPAQKEWDKLAEPIQKQFRSKLRQRLESPRVLKDQLVSLKDCYKIKLRSVGYRLVYRVMDHEIIVEVISIGKREKGIVYQNAQERLQVRG